jgi:hypothetical protein
MLNNLENGMGGFRVSLSKHEHAARSHPGFYGFLDLLERGHTTSDSNYLPQILILDTVDQEGLL